MDWTQLFGVIIGVLFVVAFVIERWVSARRWNRVRERKTWWQEPPDDGPEGDY